MNLVFNEELAKPYKNVPQQIRVMSEAWAEKNLYCVVCGGKLIPFSRKNEPVGDLRCATCGQKFEVKAKRIKLGKEIRGASYRAMIKKIEERDVPTFFFLAYCPCCYWVNDIVVVPGHYFTKKMIKRANKPCAKNRANDFTSLIRFGEIPSLGKVDLIKNRKVVAKSKVRSDFKMANSVKGWLPYVRNCITSLTKKRSPKEFTLNELYNASEKSLKKKFPNNKNREASIRLQIQHLSDSGYLEPVDKNGNVIKRGKAAGYRVIAV